MNRLLPALAAAIAGILVGTGIVATRFVIGQSDPASLALWRYGIGALCLLVPFLLMTRAVIARRDLLPICLLGIVQFAVLIVLHNYSLRHIPAALGSVIFASLPLLTLVIGAGLGREPITLPKAAGVGLTILGVALALGDRLAVPAGGGLLWLGALAMLASAFCGALCSVLYRPYLQRYPSLQVSFLAMVASVVFLCLPAGAAGFFTQLPRFTEGGWLAVVFLGVSSGGGYYLWLWALNHTTPTRVTIFLALSPVTATALGAWLLGERVSGLFLLGLAAVALGLVLAHLDRR
ncbi:MAG: DMT family transporter [Pseudomonadota bacterium]